MSRGGTLSSREQLLEEARRIEAETLRQAALGAETTSHEQDPLLSEESEDQPWLVSYADLMTLLFGLFAMMFSFATFDESGMERVNKALSKTFSESQKARPDLAQRIKVALEKSAHIQDLEVRPSADGLEITFLNSTLFGSGSATLTSQGQAPLEAIVAQLRSEATPAAALPLIRVEGHTDDEPISTAQFPSNWELSSARAATIIHAFERLEYPASRLEAIGYGAARPVAENRDKEGAAIPANQARNRRVIIKLVIGNAAEG